jgi:hypothetical protein
MADIKEKQELTEVSTYRCLYSMSMLAPNPSGMNRTQSALGQVLLQESNASDAPSGDDTDYTVAKQFLPISAEHPHKFKITLDLKHNHWTHVTKWRTKKIEGSSVAEVENLFVFVEDYPLVHFGYILGFEYGEPYPVPYTDRMVSRVVIKSKTLSLTNYHGVTFYSQLGSFVIRDLIEYEEASQTYKFNVIHNRLNFDGGNVPVLQWMSSVSRNLFDPTPRGELTQVGKRYYLEITNKSYTNDSLGVFYLESGVNFVAVKKISDTLFQVQPLGQTEKQISDVYGSTRFLQYSSDTSISVGDFSVWDAVEDSVLQARIESENSIYILNSRFTKALPNSIKATAKNGVLFNAYQDKYQYCQLEDKSRAGYYSEIYQEHQVMGYIERIVTYPRNVIVFGSHFTLAIDTNFINTVGEANFGEAFIQFLIATLVTDTIGCSELGYYSKLYNGFELLITNEQAVRVFNGFQYGPDLSDGKINHALISSLRKNFIIKWIPNKGITFWGEKNGDSVR